MAFSFIVCLFVVFVFRLVLHVREWGALLVKVWAKFCFISKDENLSV